MSLLDVINNRISELQSATDAKYKAAGYEVPTASQRKAAEFNGVNPYEYATQLKQAETAQKEAEKAAKKAAKAAQKSSSSRSSSGSSGSYSSSGSAEYESQGESSDMWASMLGEDESETIPSVKDFQQMQQESFQRKKARRRAKGAEKQLEEYREQKKEEAKQAWQENKPKKLGDREHSKPIEEEPEVPSLPENLFAQGSMEKNLYDIRNAEMADKSEEYNTQQLVNQYRQEAAAKGVDLDEELAKMNEYNWNDDKTIEELVLEMDKERHPEKYQNDQNVEQEIPKIEINSNTIKQFTKGNVKIPEEYEQPIKEYIDNFYKEHPDYTEHNGPLNKILKDDMDHKLDYEVAYDEFYHVDLPLTVYNYNQKHGTDLTIHQFLEQNSIKYSEYQDWKIAEKARAQLSQYYAFAAGVSNMYLNGVQAYNKAMSYLPWTDQAAEKERQANNPDYAMQRQIQKNTYNDMMEGFKTQYPATNFSGDMLMKILTSLAVKGMVNPFVTQVAEKAGGGPLAIALATNGVDLAGDIASDTIPEMIANYNSGMPLDEVLEKAGVNVLVNAGINLTLNNFIPGAADAFGFSKKSAAEAAEKAAAEYAEELGKATPFDLSDDTLKELLPSLNQTDDVLKAAADTNVLDDLVKQAEADDISKAILGPLSDTKPTKTLDDFASEWDDIVKGADNSGIPRFGNVENVKPDIPNVTDVQGKTIRIGLNAIDPASNLSYGSVVSQYTDSMKQAVEDWGTKHVDLLDNADVSANYNNLKKAVDDFADMALHSDDNLDTFYRSVEDAKDKLAKTVRQLDEGAANDKILGQKFSSNASIMKNADNARAVVNNIQPSISQAPKLAEDVKPVTEAISNISSANLETLKMRVVNANRSDDLWNIWREALDGNIDPASRKELSDLINGKLSSLYPPREAATLADSMNLDNAAKNVVSPEAPKSTPVTNAPVEGGKVPIDNTSMPEKGSGADKTSKYRTNSLNKSDAVNETNFPTDDYKYKTFGVEEQRAAVLERYKNSVNPTSDLLSKNAWDEVDARYAQDRMKQLLEEGNDIEAARLARRQSYELREGGRLIQVAAEMDDTAGQMSKARQIVNKHVDKLKGAGTSEALDNFAMQAEKQLDGIDLTTKEGRQKAADILDDMMSKNMKEYAPSNTNMKPKKFQKTKDIVDGINNGKYKSVDDIINRVYMNNGGAPIKGGDQKKIYDLLEEAKQFEAGSREQERLLAQAAKLELQNVPTTFGDKVRGVLYMNMLGNFKTAVSRNAFGNYVYQGLEGLRSPIAATVDRATSLVTKEHTTTGWNAQKLKAYFEGFKKGAADQLDDVKLGVSTGRSGELGWVEALKNNKGTFNYSGDNKVLQGLSDMANKAEFYVKSAMQFGDRPVFEANYAARQAELYQLLEKYGKNGVAGLSAIPDDKIADTIDMLSSVYAAEAVFQNKGLVATGLGNIRNGLSEISKGTVGADLLSTAASPFTLTPGNLVEKAIDYSPLGFVKNGIQTAREIGNGAFDQKRFVDQMSRSILGLPILGGTIAIANNGVINGGYSDDNDEKQAQYADGYIEYGFNVPEGVPYYGGKTFNTSDLPVLGPFMQAGAEIADNGLTLSGLAQGAAAITGGSTMQGIRRLTGADSNFGSTSSVDSLKNTVLSSGSQLVPSLLRQTAQTMDEYKRDLGEYGTNEYYWNSVLNSIPFLRQTLPVKYDTEGNPVLQNDGRSLPEKILENYVLPMNVSEYSPSELNQEASRLLDATDNAGGFAPQAKRSDLRKWDENASIDYTEEQYREYKKDLGTLNSDAGMALISSEAYQSLSAGNQVQALSALYGGMKQVAKENATGIPSDDKVAAAYKEGGIEGAIDYVNNYYAIKDAVGDQKITVNETTQDIYENGITVGGKTVTGADALQLYLDAGEWCKENGLQNSKDNRAAYYADHISEYTDTRRQRQRPQTASPEAVTEIADMETPTAASVPTSVPYEPATQTSSNANDVISNQIANAQQQPTSQTEALGASIPSLEDVRNARQTINDYKQMMRDYTGFGKQPESSIPSIADTSNMSETDKLLLKQEQTAIMEQYGLDYSKENAKLLDKYGETALEAKQILNDSDYSFNDSAKDIYKAGGVPAIQDYVDTMNSFDSVGLDTSTKVYENYQHALETYPNLTPAQYANIIQSIDQNDNSLINEEEFKAYVNANAAYLSEEEIAEMWRVLSTSSKTPYIITRGQNKGKWGLH